MGEKGKFPVTASLLNVPVDSAVLILAEMAELKPVLIDRVIYVTTPENATRLRREMNRRGMIGEFPGTRAGSIGPAGM